MHPTHNTRPQHMRHHLHQPGMHPQRPPPVGINVGPQMRPPQHHHMSNMPPHGGHQQISSYIPPMQRDATRSVHHQPRMNSQMHHAAMQSKYRPGAGRGMGISNASMNQSNTQSGLQQSTHSIQHTHNLQQSHNLSQQPHSLPQHQNTHNKPPEVSKQSSVQKSQQGTVPQPGIASQPPVSVHQKIGQQQIGPSQQSQQSVMSPMPAKNSSPMKPMGIKHSQSSLTFKSSQAPNAHPNPIRISHSQPSMHPQTGSGKSFQSYKPMQSQKIPPHPHQPMPNRQNNPPPQRSSPPQKIQAKGSNLVSANPPLLPTPAPTHSALSISPSSKPSPVHNKPPPNTASASTTASTSIPPAPLSLHQQHKSIPIAANNTHPSGPPISIVQQQTQAGSHSASTNSETLKATTDNQLKTQGIQQNSNPSVSTNQQDMTSDLACGNSRNLPTNDNLANTKEKTPMCLVNELARFNKIQHQYRLTGEDGPAHCKRFTVTLKLGDEDYTAEGLSIKKAQHAAASEAINNTKYQHPPIKSTRLKNGRPGIGYITPTVELNALLMKLGEPAVYVTNPTDAPSHQGMGAPASQNGFPIPVHNHGYVPDGHFTNFNRPNNNNFYSSPRFQRMNGRPFNRGYMKYGSRFPAPMSGPREVCKITLIVGKHTFVGFGDTPQLAKHDAATKALTVLKPLVVVDGSAEVQGTAEEDPSSDLKSPISLVHETALKRNMTVTFEVKSERGQPHMKTFVTMCKVGDIMTEAEGNGKKISKKRAAEKMLDELKKLPPLSPSKINTKMMSLKSMKRKPPMIKRKPKNLIKENPDPEVPQINPISKLLQVQQSLKEREPVYTLIDETGYPRPREFVIEVSAGGQVARGVGHNKKTAKKVAARNMLIMMGYPMPEIDETITSNGSNEKTRNYHEENHVAPSPNIHSKTGCILGRQIVPGLLLMQQTSKNSFTKPPDQYNQQQQQQSSSASATAKEDNNPSNQPNLSTPLAVTFNKDGVRPKDQLLYLAQLLGFQAVFSDYPKGNHGEYLTIVTLSTDPPQICHGAGGDTDESQDQASMTALQMLSELGLDNVKPKKPPEEKKADSNVIEGSKE